MKLYLISQDTNDSRETYISAVVAATSAECAQMTHPDGSSTPIDTRRQNAGTEERDWVTDPALVHVEYLGETKKPAGVICAHFWDA